MALRWVINETRQFWLGISLAAIIFLGSSCLYLPQPGLYYDEVLFASAALPGPADSLEHQWHFGKWQVPVMLNPYVGALKAWLYAGIFHLFPPNPLAVRLPMILAGLGTLLFTALIARRFWGPRPALWVAFLLATDPSFIFTVRLDWGPVALMLFFKTAAITCFLSYLRTSHGYWLGFTGLFLGLGVFDKANFLWFVLAVPPAVLLTWRLESLRWLTRRRSLILLAGFLVGAAPLLIYNLQRPGEMAKGQLGFTQPFLVNLTYKARLAMDTMNGNGAQTAVFGDKAIPPLTPAGRLEPRRTFMSAVLGAGFLFWLLSRGPGKGEGRKPALFFFWLAVFIFLQVLISAKATGQHHAMMLFPFQHLFLGGVISVLLPLKGTTGTILPARRKIAGQFFSACLCLLVLSNILLGVKYLQTIHSEGGQGVWSDAIYQLVDFAKSRPSSCLMHLDWGARNSLLLLGGRAVCQQEVFWEAESLPESAAIQWLYRLSQQPRNLFLSICPPFSQKPTTRNRFEKMLSQHHLRARLVRLFFQRDGRPVYRLEQVEGPSQVASDPAHLFFVEAEAWMEKNGGDVDLKGPASGGMALGMHWGERIADSASYWFSLERDIQDLELRIRYAFSDANPHFYLFSLDGVPRRIYSFEFSGGFGYTETQWRVANFPLGSVPRGPHVLKIQPAGNSQNINLDWLEFREKNL